MTALLIADRLHTNVHKLFTFKKEVVLTEAEEFDLEIKEIVEDARRKRNEQGRA
ncbi:MAG: hypothetical protein ABI425_02095 [Patescibacteria group bacterium]